MAGPIAWRNARRESWPQRAISRASSRMGRSESAQATKNIHGRSRPSEHREQVGEVAGEREGVEAEEHHRPEPVKAGVLVHQEEQRDQHQEQQRPSAPEPLFT